MNGLHYTQLHGWINRIFREEKKPNTKKNETEKSTRLTTVFMDAYLGEKLKTKTKTQEVIAINTWLN